MLNALGQSRLCDYVETTEGAWYKGRVTRIASTFADTGLTAQWFHDLRAKWPEETLHERWIHILVHGGGSVCIPERAVAVIPPFEFENSHAAELFREWVVARESAESYRRATLADIVPYLEDGEGQVLRLADEIRARIKE